MINATDFDQRMADHLARIDRANRGVATRAATAPAGGTRALAISTVTAAIRQRMGAAVVRAGERLQGATVRRAADPAAL